MTVLTQSRLMELVVYDQDTGLFTWRIRRANVRAGSIAGCVAHDKSIVFSVDDKLYRAHRLAWLYVTGKWPDEEIDHIDRNPANNKWSNLRPASRSQNVCNTTLRKDNTSGHKGVWWDKRRNKWVAEIIVSKKKYHLGVFSNIDAAVAAQAAKRALLHGEYAHG